MSPLVTGWLTRCRNFDRNWLFHFFSSISSRSISSSTGGRSRASSLWLITQRLGGGRGRRRCPHPRWSRSMHRFSMIFWLSSGCCSSLRWKKGKRKTGQEDSLEVDKRRKINVEETTTHMDGHDDGREWSADKCSNLSQCECDEMCTREVQDCARS